MARRSRTNTDVLDWQELEQAPNVRGAFSFLTVPAQVISIDQHGNPSRDPATVDNASTVDITSTVDISTTVDKTTTVDGHGSPDADKRAYKIHRCRIVQDGHSHGETILYDTLWREGTDGPVHRLVTMGWDAMARKAQMSDKTAKRNLRGLISKLAVELVEREDSAQRIGRTYRIFSYDEILKRRKAAGMEYVVRDKGVRFVSPNGDPLRPERHASARDSVIPSTVDVLSTVDKTSTVSLDKTSPVSVDKTSPLIGSYIDNSLGNSSSTSSQVDEFEVYKALTDYASADLHAARQLIRGCLSACPDVRIAEIVELIHQKAATMNAGRAIANPTGFLLTAVPRCCEGAAMDEFRRQQVIAADREQRRCLAKQEREREQMEFFRREYQRNLAIASDPASPVEQVQRAAKAIADLEIIFQQAGIAPAQERERAQQ